MFLWKRSKLWKNHGYVHLSRRSFKNDLEAPHVRSWLLVDNAELRIFQKSYQDFLPDYYLQETEESNEFCIISISLFYIPISIHCSSSVPYSIFCSRKPVFATWVPFVDATRGFISAFCSFTKWSHLYLLFRLFICFLLNFGAKCSNSWCSASTKIQLKA